MASVERVLETCLSVAELESAMQFYVDLFRFPILFANERLCAFDVGGTSVLILFAKGKSVEPAWIDGGMIPPHDASGTSHFAFAIGAGEYEPWRAELQARNIAIESEVRWALGGRSLYFRDPDEHLVELATPGLWRTY